MAERSQGEHVATWPEHRVSSPMETLEKVMLSLSARSHPGRYPEGRWAYGARVQRGQNGFNILKVLGGAKEEAFLASSPVQDTRERTDPTHHIQICLEVMVLLQL